MTQVSGPAINPGKISARALASAISLLALFVITGAILFITLRSPLKDDIAWLLYVARRWLAGRELYVDVVEVNPPLIVWISAIPLQIARWLDVDSRFVAMPVFVALVLGCAWWTASLIRVQARLFTDRLSLFAIIGSVLLILPAADLGQREHLLVAAFLPYLMLFARSLDGQRSPLITSLLAGVAAALGCALKPRYCGVFAVLECLALTRGLRPWRIMPIAAGTTLAGYVVLIAALCPAYMQRAVPMALALYGATDVPFRELLADSALLLVGQGVAASLLFLRRRTLANYNLMLTLVVFAATSTVICFIDGKDWYYHRLPATVITVLALLLWISNELTPSRSVVRLSRRWVLRLPLAVACLAITTFSASAVIQLEPEAMEAVASRPTAVDRLENIIRTEHARSYIAFSEWIALGFPVVNETGVAWASRFDSMWALKGEVWRARLDPSVGREWPIARWVSHDFIAGCPDLAVVDTRETTQYIAVLSAADPAFARAWTRYRPIAAFGGLVVYRRGKGGCLDVWVAAESRPSIDAR